MLRRLLSDAGIAVMKQSTLERLVSQERLLKRNEAFPSFVEHLNPSFVATAVDLLPFSRGEIFQDIFAALMLQDVETGFFVEFGATDGIEGSNTWLFEKHLGWNGLLAEPARGWHSRLSHNRRTAISTKCVWRESGTSMEFTEARDGGLSTLSKYAFADSHADRRRIGKTYSVPTITLNDLFEEFEAPSRIDFMSVDTEGSEFDILCAFNFDRWKIGVLCVEHNYRPERDDIHALLSQHGYSRAPIELSRFDDWYVSEILIDKMHRVLRTLKKGAATSGSVQGTSGA
jgi:FkbM family methyltransferase